MAGYIKIYCVGELGGFEGADGVNHIYFQILEGVADRQWLEVHYFIDKIKPIGSINIIVPEHPDNRNMLLDACIAFYPNYFEKCPSLKIVKAKLKDAKMLDFNLESDKIPEEWEALRKEALPLFKKMHIFEAELKEIRK